MAVIYLFFHTYINEPFWSRLEVRIILYLTHANGVRKADYHTYKKYILTGRHYERGLKSK